MDHIYFISDQQGRVKVGRSVDPAIRLAALQGANADELSLLGVIPLLNAQSAEQGLHSLLHEQHIRGEWFRDGPKIRGLLALLASPYTDPRPLLECPVDLGELLPES